VLIEFARQLREQGRLLRFRGLAGVANQAITLGIDAGSQPDGLCAKILGLLASRIGIGNDLSRLFSPLRDEVGNRAKEEPAEDPDENEDVDGLEHQRPPVNMHEPSG
jgi:hypothetical protein